MPRLSAEEQERAVGMLQTGSTDGEVAAAFGCHRLTILRLRQRLLNTGTTSDRPRSGRPPVTTPHENRYLRQLHLTNRFQTATVTENTALARRISPQTEVVPFGGGSVMVWGGIRGDRKTDLVVIDGNLTVQRYINQVLQPEVLLFTQQNPNS
ncbi:uncharacterized protein [Haliotis asinina]|uniref:uncharacterized protein n=1 Tax=Haliotis asinina TaxID=109174 RepID=UPI0035319DB8